MPYQWCWVNDAADDEAEKAGRLTIAEAARRAGMYPKWVNSRIAGGVLKTVQRYGRTYIDAQSLAEMIARDGQGGSVIEQLEQLRSEGRSWEAAALLERLNEEQARVNARTPGYSGPIEQPSTVTRDMVDPGESFVRKYGGGQ